MADTDNIFFSGSIETAIASAISRGLSLACFIADDGGESLKWEREYMKDEEVFPLMQSQCVLLRLQAGSVEAGFLAAFCPIQAVPYLVIIKNGQLVANIVAGASQEEFITGIKTALPEISQVVPEAPQLGVNEPIQPPASTSLLEAPQPEANEPIQSPASTPLPESSPTPPPASAINSAYTAALEDRRTRLEAQRAEQEAADRATIAARNAARRESSAGTTDPPGRSSNLTYLEQQRKRQHAAQEERRRVLQLLENDKIERRQREAKRKEAEQQASSSSSAAREESTPKPATPRPLSKETAISFRLLDGSSLKSRFPSDSKLGTDVRAWLDSNRNDGDHPYSFLQILAPLPNKPLSLSDENSTLLELDLAPTATLVLVPAQSFTTAYSGGGASNEVGLLSRAYGLVYGAITTVLGVGYPSAPVVPPPAPSPAAAAAAPTPAAGVPLGRTTPVGGLGATLGRAGRSEARGEPGQSMSRASSANGRIRTLYDAGEDGGGGEEGRKYYNGNQLDFEPKRDEKGKERKE